MDILVNNAGTIERAPAAEHPTELWDRVIQVNLSSQFTLTQAIAGLTKALSNEWAGKGITVNAIAPGYNATDNTQALQDDPHRSKAILDRIPAGRWGVGSRRSVLTSRRDATHISFSMCLIRWPHCSVRGLSGPKEENHGSRSWLFPS